MLCFSTSEDSTQFISYTSPSHVKVFSGHTKGQPLPTGDGALRMRRLTDRAGTDLQPSQCFGTRTAWGRELRAPVPHQALPQPCSQHRVLAPMVLDCSHPSETQPGMRRTRTFLGLVELEAQLASPNTAQRGPKNIQTTPKKITSQLLKLYGMRRGGSICAT